MYTSVYKLSNACVFALVLSISSTSFADSEVTISTSVWHWDGSNDSDWFNQDNWGFAEQGVINDPFLTAPTSNAFPVYIGPVDYFVNGLFTGTFLPTSDADISANYSISPSLNIVSTENAFVLTVSGGTYTTSASIGTTATNNYVPAGPVQPVTVRLDGGCIDGSWSFVGLGKLEALAGSCELGNVITGTLEGLVVGNSATATLGNGSYLNIRSSLENNGTLQFASTGTQTQLVIDDAVSLSGTGTIDFGTGPAAISASNSGFVADILTLEAGSTQTFAGTGALQNSSVLGLINNGNMIIDGTIGLSTTLTNNATLTVEDGGDLSLTGGVIQSGTLVTNGTGILSSGSSGTLDGVSSSGTIVIDPQRTLNLKSSFVNNGTIRVGDPSSSTTILQIEDSVLLSGTGFIDLVNGSSLLRSTPNGVVPDILTIDSGATQTLTGSGAIQNSSILGLVNNGDLIIDGTIGLGSTLTNNATLTVEDGGDLSLTGGVILGGTLVTNGTGILSSGSSGTLDDVSSSGTIIIDPQRTLNLKSSFVNNGTIRVGDPSSSTTVLQIEDNVLLSGTGSIDLVNGSSSLRSTPSGVVPDILTIDSGATQTFTGAGVIQSSSIFELVNNGDMVIDGTIGLGSTLTNNATLTVEDGGDLSLIGGVIQGGTLVTNGTGILSSGFFGTLDGLNSSGTIVIDPQGTLNLRSSFINNGTIRVGDPSSSTTVLQIEDSVSLSGVGSLELPSSSSILRATSNGAVPDVLTLEAGGQLTVTGLGAIDNFSIFEFINEGSLSIDGDIRLGSTLINNSTLTIEDGGTFALTSGLIQGGAITTNGSGVLTSRSAGTLDNVTNQGAILIEPQRQMTFQNGLVNEGTISVGDATSSATYFVVNGDLFVSGAGTIDLPSNSSQIWSSGSASLELGANQQLTGTGTINVPTTINGIVSPGASPGSLSFGSDLDFGEESRITIELFGAATSQYDVLSHSGSSLDLGGDLEIFVDPAYLALLTPGDTFTVISSFTNLSGSFQNVLPGERLIANGGSSFIVDYGPASADPTSVVLSSHFDAGLAPEDNITNVSGEATGGTVTIVVNGVEISIATTAGDSAADVASALAAAINVVFPGQAQAVDNLLVLTGLAITSFVTSDSGLSGDLLTFEPVPEVRIPLPLLTYLVLGLILALIGHTTRQRALFRH